MSTQPYYLRSTDRAALVAACATAKIATDSDEGFYEIYQSSCVGVVELGILYQPTGEVVDDGFGNVTYAQTPIVDSNNLPFWHINILADLSPDQLATLKPFLLVDASGNPKAPNSPYCVFAGW